MKYYKTKKEEPLSKNKSTLSILAALTCNTFWGFSFLCSRVALNSAPVIVLLSHRFLLAWLLMSLLIPLRRNDFHLKGKPILPLVLLGLLEPVIYFFGEQYGILHSSTIFSGVMIATIPIVSTLAAAPILRERPTLGQLACSALSVAGVIGIGLITRSSGSIDWIGVLALCVAVLSAVGYTLLNRGISTRYSPFERTYCMLMIGAVFFTAMALFHVRLDWNTYLRPLRELSYLRAVLYLSTCCSVICYFLSSYILTNLSVAKATVFANLTTAVSVFAGAVFLHEPFTPIGILFCAMILVGIYGVQKAS